MLVIKLCLLFLELTIPSRYSSSDAYSYQSSQTCYFLLLSYLTQLWRKRKSASEEQTSPHRYPSPGSSRRYQSRSARYERENPFPIWGGSNPPGQHIGSACTVTVGRALPAYCSTFWVRLEAWILPVLSGNSVNPSLNVVTSLKDLLTMSSGPV